MSPVWVGCASVPVASWRRATQVWRGWVWRNSSRVTSLTGPTITTPTLPSWTLNTPTLPFTDSFGATNPGQPGQLTANWINQAGNYAVNTSTGTATGSGTGKQIDLATLAGLNANNVAVQSEHCS